MYHYNIYEILDDIQSGRRKKVILDSDTYNEEDDQYAVAYAMLSPDTIDLLALQAAPYFNDKSTGPEDGMLKSYEELVNIARLTNPNHNIPIFKGSRQFLSSTSSPVDSPAADNIIHTAKNSSERIYIIAIGAITNVASAILKCPEIVRNLVVIWLGSHAEWTHEVGEFNMAQDVKAAQVLFDSQVPIVLIPALGGTVDLSISVQELEEYLSGKNPLCDYLYHLVYDRMGKPFCGRKIIWDIGGIAAICLKDSMELTVSPTPILLDEMYGIYDPRRHPMILASRLNHDAIYADLITKLTSLHNEQPKQLSGQ